MRLGFDLDGTVANLRSALVLQAVRLFPGVDLAAVPGSPTPESGARLAPAALHAGVSGATPETVLDLDEEPDDLTQEGFAPASSAPPSVRSLSSRQQRQVWKAVCARENFWETLEEMDPGSLARLYRMVQDRRWELIFLTSRPDTRGDSVQTQTHRWLTAKGYQTPSVFVVQGSRGRIAAALELDIVVDDRPENCLDVAVDSNARPILIWRDDQGPVPGGARQLGIGSVQSIGDCLDLLDSLHQAETGQGSLMERLKRLLGLKSSTARMGQAGEVAPPVSRERATSSR